MDKYNDFIEAYRKAYPDMFKKRQYEQANKEWMELKKEVHLDFFLGGGKIVLPTSYGRGVSRKSTFADMGEVGVKKWGKIADVLNGQPQRCFVIPIRNKVFC